MSEEESQKSERSGSQPPTKKLSPLEQIRAKAVEQTAEAGQAEVAGAGKPTTKLSPLEQMRAKAAAKQEPSPGVVGGDDPKTTPKAQESPKPATLVTLEPTRPVPKPKPPKVKPSGSAASIESRRFWMFSWIGIAWTSFTAGCSAATLSAVRFMFPNVLREPPSLFKIGPPDQFADGEVSLRWKNSFAVWVVRNEDTLFALRSVCTHLGCTPNWLEGEQKFKCPCHGSGFRKTGINFEGPAPRPLERHAIIIADDGQVQIDKSKILHQELGQWTPENNAFIELT